MMRLRPQRLFTTFPDDAQLGLFPEVRQQVVWFLSTEAGLAKRHWPKLIKRVYPELKEYPLEDILVRLVVRSFLIRHELMRTRRVRLHDCVEFCSGQGQLTLACRLAGAIPCELDIEFY